MMKTLALIALLFAFACDDAGVSTKVADVLANGAVTGSVECLEQTSISLYSGTKYRFTASRLQDGSCFSTAAFLSSSSATLNGRSETHAESCRTEVVLNSNSVMRFELDSASLTVELFDEFPAVAVDDSDSPLDLETECTGFNLAAFGVE
jgi:hypothetical protein